jgi:hypothetical protein
MLSARQVLALVSRQSQPPLKLSTLLPLLDVNTLSLRSLTATVSGQRALFLVQVRDVSVLKTVGSLDELKQKWPTLPGSRSALEQLSKIVTAVGGSITFVDKHAYKSVIINGPAESLASIPTTAMDQVDNIAGHFADAFIAAGGVLIGMGSVPEPASPLLVTAGAAAAGVGVGLKLGIGIWELAVEMGADDVGTLQVQTVSGSVDDPNAILVVRPSDVNVQDVINLGEGAPAINLQEIEDLPPNPPDAGNPDGPDTTGPPPPPPDGGP